MSVTEVEIINNALIELGQDTITDRQDRNKAARLVDAIFDSQRDIVLAAHAWTCATARAKLTRLATAPAFGYTDAFLLPTDFLRVIEVNELNEGYAVETLGGDWVLLLNASEANLLYVHRLTDVSKMSPTLQDCIAAKLAAQLALPMTGDKAKYRDLQNVYRDKLADAQLVDSTERATEQVVGGEWLASRSAAGGNRIEDRGIDTGV